MYIYTNQLIADSHFINISFDSNYLIGLVDDDIVILFDYMI